MRANLIGTFTTLGEDEWECMENPRDEKYWKKMLVALAFFHAITQERRKYGPLGWNIRYEFNTSDVLCAKDVLKMFVRNFDELPWDAITYITGHVNYGGRVTDDQDRRCLMSILSTYYPGESVVQDDSYKFSDSGTRLRRSYHLQRSSNMRTQPHTYTDPPPHPPYTVPPQTESTNLRIRSVF